MEPSTYRRGLDGISRAVAEVARAVGRFLSGPKPDEAARDAAAAALYPAIVSGRDKAHALSVEFAKGQAEAHGYTDTVPVPAIRDYDQAATRKAIDNVLDSASSDVEGDLARASVLHTENAAREAVADTAKMSQTPDPATRETRKPIRWARTLTGAENCAFCITLASRGIGLLGNNNLYLSRQSALYSGGDAASNALDANKERFHHGCDCVAVPVYDLNDWPGRETADFLYHDVYQAARELYDDDEELNPTGDPFKSVRLYLQNNADEIDRARKKEDLDEGVSLNIPDMRSGDVDGEDAPEVLGQGPRGMEFSRGTEDLIRGIAEDIPSTGEDWDDWRKTEGGGMTWREWARERAVKEIPDPVEDKQRMAQAKRELKSTRDNMDTYLRVKGKTRDTMDPEDSTFKIMRESEDDILAKMAELERRIDKSAYIAAIRAGEHDNELHRHLPRGARLDDFTGYEADEKGRMGPSAALVRQTERVRDAGRAGLRDWEKAQEKDAELTELLQERESMLARITERRNELNALRQESNALQVKVSKAAAARARKGGGSETDSPPQKETPNEKKLRLMLEREAELEAELLDMARAAGPHNEKIAVRRRAILLEMMGNYRPMTEEGDLRLNAKTKPLEAVMREASTVYPADWTRRANEKFPQPLKVGQTGRGYYQSGMNGDGIKVVGEELMLSRKARSVSGWADDRTVVAVHELGHRAQASIRHISSLEWAYLANRSRTNSGGKMGNFVRIPEYGPKEIMFPNARMGDDYTAKVYGWARGYEGRKFADAPDPIGGTRSTEVLTTGMEALMGLDNHYNPEDDSLRELVLGLLLTI